MLPGFPVTILISAYLVSHQQIFHLRFVSDWIADRVSDVLFDEVDDFKENAKSFKLTDVSATC